MDSEHRHELKENDLATFLTHFGEWWGKHGTNILIVITVLLIVVLGYRFLDMRATTAHNEAWSDLAATASPEGYRTLAETHKDPAVQALAYLRGGDLLLAQSTSASAKNVDGADAVGTPQEALENAKVMYQQVLSISQEPVYRVNAMMGLAAVAEAERNWEQAGTYYRQVIGQAQEKMPWIAADAQKRLDLLDRLAEPIAFAPEPVLPAAAPAEAATEAQAALSIEAPSADESAAPAPQQSAPQTGQ